MGPGEETRCHANGRQNLWSAVSVEGCKRKGMGQPGGEDPPLTLHLMFFLHLSADSAQKGRGLRPHGKAMPVTVLWKVASSVYKYGYQLSPCGPCPAAADSGQTLWPSEVRAEKLGMLIKEEIRD